MIGPTMKRTVHLADFKRRRLTVRDLGVGVPEGSEGDAILFTGALLLEGLSDAYEVLSGLDSRHRVEILSYVDANWPDWSGITQT